MSRRSGLALRQPVLKRSKPYDSEKWVAQAVAQFDLQITLGDRKTVHGSCENIHDKAKVFRAEAQSRRGRKENGAVIYCEPLRLSVSARVL